MVTSAAQMWTHSGNSWTSKPFVAPLPDGTQASGGVRVMRKTGTWTEVQEELGTLGAEAGTPEAFGIPAPS